MRLRTGTKKEQWCWWSFELALSLGVYILLARLLGNNQIMAILRPELMRIFFPVALVCVFFMYQTRCDGRGHGSKKSISQRLRIDHRTSDVSDAGDEEKTADTSQRLRIDHRTSDVSDAGEEEKTADTSQRLRIGHRTGDMSDAGEEGKTVDTSQRLRIDHRTDDVSDAGEEEKTTDTSQRLRIDHRTSDVSDAGDEEKPEAKSQLQRYENINNPEKLWQLAREMPHNYIPDFDTDEVYLHLVYRSAEGGYAVALEKLSEYALRRSAFVEAYYWGIMSERRGNARIHQHLASIRLKWVQAGRPAEFENLYWAFPQERAVLARALLCIASGINVNYSHSIIRNMAEQGNTDAKLFV